MRAAGSRRTEAAADWHSGAAEQSARRRARDVWLGWAAGTAKLGLVGKQGACVRLHTQTLERANELASEGTLGCRSASVSSSQQCSANYAELTERTSERANERMSQLTESSCAVEAVLTGWQAARLIQGPSCTSAQRQQQEQTWSTRGQRSSWRLVCRSTGTELARCAQDNPDSMSTVPTDAQTVLSRTGRLAQACFWPKTTDCCLADSPPWPSETLQAARLA